MFLHCDVVFPQCHVLIDGKLGGGGGGGGIGINVNMLALFFGQKHTMNIFVMLASTSCLRALE